MFTTIRYYYKNSIEGETMNNTIKDFNTIEQAIKYAHRYAKGNKFAGIQVEDENGKLLYEITSDFNVYDYR